MLKFKKQSENFVFSFFFFCFVKEPDNALNHIAEQQPKPKCSQLKENLIKGEKYPL
jgi:hypothetical protein